MFRIAQIFVFVVGLATAGLSSIPGLATAQVRESVAIADVAGTYIVQGRNADGSKYSGTVTVTNENGKAVFQWDVENGSFRGVGSLTGNVLVVNWGDQPPIIYTIGVDGSLAGTWDKGLASEQLTRQ